MRPSLCSAVAAVALFAVVLSAQNSTEEFRVYTEHPRLLLNAKRLRLLRREKERQSLRYNQFESLMRGRAAMPEPAFASALWSQVTSEPAPCRDAIAIAVRPETDVRQSALVFDWCQTALAEPQLPQLRVKLERAVKGPLQPGFSAARDRAFAAVVLSDGTALKELVSVWWRGGVAKALTEGTRDLAHADLYPFAELVHVIRDNLQIDLRDNILPVFRDLPLRRLLSYYPAAWPAPENEFRIPFFHGQGEPDLRLASLTRAAEFALVAYESNAQEMQFLQGWLLLDRFALRGAFGAPYEFLWANPYHPGLPFQKMPLVAHQPSTGTLFVRSTWEEDADWLGFFEGKPQLFREGQIRPAPIREPLSIGPAMILGGAPAGREFRVPESAPDEWFLLSLKPSTEFDVETDEEEMTAERSDRGGILRLRFGRRAGQAVYVHEPRVPAAGPN